MPDDDLTARVAEFNARVARWAERLATGEPLIDAQAQGWVCINCANRMTVALPAGQGPLGQVFVCERCDMGITYDPTAEQPDPDPETTPLEALAALAEDLDREGLRTYARRAHVIAARMGHLVDEVRADATMLTGYAAGVNDRAVAVGIGALREIGDLR